VLPNICKKVTSFQYHVLADGKGKPPFSLPPFFRDFVMLNGRYTNNYFDRIGKELKGMV